MSRAAPTAAALVLALAVPAAAQTGDVGLITDREAAEDPFLQFVPVPTGRRFDELEEARRAEGVAFIVELRGADGVVRIWRRSDRATLERRLEAPDPEGYALAVMGSELLEVARAGSMAEVVSVDPPAPEEEEAPAEAVPSNAEDAPAPELADEEGRLSFTGGVAFEAWVMPADAAPFQLQPAVALELAYTPAGEDWQVGGGLFAAGLGQLDRREGELQLLYQRYDLGVRLTSGVALGPARTRLLGHARLGGSAVDGWARDGSGDNRREGRRTLAGFFFGPAFEVRQPVLEGLELTLGVALDVTVEPVTFVAGGATRVQESPVRLSARLGVAYRVD